MANGLSKVLDHLHRTCTPPGSDLTDGQLLARFVASRDEPSFAALVRRHGPMVWRLCLRLLGHVQNAEDTFQATFLVLACKAATVLKHESVGSFLYGVAYRTALKAKAIHARRRSFERQVEDMPHPEIPPVEPQDWQSWLDHELNLLPEHYRAVIVACDLEGRSRKEAARQLGLSEGTISSRLARGHRLLAKRLSRYGLSLSGGALVATLAEGPASAHIPALLFSSTTKMVVGKAVFSRSVEILVKGALKSMFFAKLKLMVGAVMVVVALGASGLVYRASGQSVPSAAERKPPSELEALRRENELLKLNLEIVLEKVRAQEAELRGLKGRQGAGAIPSDVRQPQQGPTTLALDYGFPLYSNTAVSPNWNMSLLAPTLTFSNLSAPQNFPYAYPNLVPHTAKSDPAQQVEAALKMLKEAHDLEAKRCAAAALEKAIKKLREQLSKPDRPAK
jgi:RNA polymerase sigma factor (sigma-70 family)